VINAQKLKKKLRSKADRLFYDVCLLKFGTICMAEAVCISEPKKKKVIQIHHYYPKRIYNIVRYDLDNGIPLCRSCHFRHHHLGDPLIHNEVIIKKGKRWFNRLTKKARVQKSSFLTVKWYEDHIKRLERLKKKLKAPE